MGVSSLNVGFGLSGTGNIPAYTATNATNSSSCNGKASRQPQMGSVPDRQQFMVTVNPTQTVNWIEAQLTAMEQQQGGQSTSQVEQRVEP